jgi:hypothetical protein
MTAKQGRKGKIDLLRASMVCRTGGLETSSSDAVWSLQLVGRKRGMAIGVDGWAWGGRGATCTYIYHTTQH